MEDSAEDPPSRFNFASVTFLVGFGLGGFLGVTVALLAVALVSEPKSNAADLILVPDVVTTTPGLVASAPDRRPRTKSQLDVHLGPGVSFAVVGLLSRGEAVEVVGRDNDAGWVAIRFPPGSAGRGWVPVADLEGLSDVGLFAVVLPTPLSRTVTLPVPGLSNDSGGGASSAPRSGSPPPSATTGPQPGDPTDLAIGRVSLLPDGRVSVVVANRGPGNLSDQIVIVVVRDLISHTEQLISARAIPAGGTLTLETQLFRITRDTEIQVLLDPSASIKDPDRSNNFFSTTLILPVTPTPTPTSEPQILR